jgi:hypothetical protein
MSSYIKYAILWGVGVVLFFTCFEYYDWATPTDTSRYYGKINTVCITHKPAQSFQIDLAQCMEIK